jgi:hypothetical protein
MQATCEKKNALRRDQKWNRRSRTGKGRTSKDNLGKSSTKSGSGLQDSLLPRKLWRVACTSEFFTPLGSHNPTRDAFLGMGFGKQMGKDVSSDPLAFSGLRGRSLKENYRC